MHPYQTLSDEHFWSKAIASRAPDQILYDPTPRFRFTMATDQFATAGSCFAQHFGRELAARGGRLLLAESRHPLIDADANHGYSAFSARYGNLYTTTQLRELFEQACGVRAPVFEFVRREDGRWVDMLRPRAIPDGLSTEEDCRADRGYHLARVRSMMQRCTVFVFTLGLTESWVNRERGHAYGLCPGVAAGHFDPGMHEFRNLSFAECHRDLVTALQLLWRENPAAKVLLTVSPVMLVATCEARGVLQSSVASKSILRAVADECVRTLPQVDYFPSYEIISAPPARGRYFDATGRDVTADGVKLVMDTFFRTRMRGDSAAASMPAGGATHEPGWRSALASVSAALEADCDEVLLDRKDKLPG